MPETIDMPAPPAAAPQGPQLLPPIVQIHPDGKGQFLIQRHPRMDVEATAYVLSECMRALATELLNAKAGQKKRQLLWTPQGLV